MTRSVTLRRSLGALILILTVGLSSCQGLGYATFGDLSGDRTPVEADTRA